MSRNSAEGLRVLLIGAGTRDHALAWSFVKSPILGELHVAPGNPGIATIATTYEHLAADDADAFVALASELQPDLVVIGAEDLLVGGLTDRIAALGLTVFGPSAAAAQIEGSKTFSKSLMDSLGIPTAPWRRFDDRAEALAFAYSRSGEVAIKADGLAAGCGAIVCHSPAEANAALDQLFADSDDAVVIVEELLEGREASVMAISDGKRVRVLPAARDYKRVGTGDTGPNTGGMGSHAPSSDVSTEEAEELVVSIIQPVIDALSERGMPFRGVLYAGVMLTADGPYVLEYNCRFGNPETQSLVRVVAEDLLTLLHQAARGALDSSAPLHPQGAAVSISIATASYPTLQLETEPVHMSGLTGVGQIPGVELFVGYTEPVAGTSSPNQGEPVPDALMARGGRAVTVSAWALTFAEAIDRAYAAAEIVEIPGKHYRDDIGAPALDGLLILG